MWFHLGFQNFVAKKNYNDVSCEIFVSDFIHIWHKSLSNEELLSTSQKLNPLFEASVQKLKDLTLNLLEDGKVKKEIKENDEDDNNSILLKLESNHLMNIKFRFDIVLNKENEEMFHKEFTLPLLCELVKIQNRERKLMEIIKNKDEEIKDYKQRYGISPNYLTTKLFSKKEFYYEESVIDIPWDNSFLDILNNKLCEMNSEIKEESSSEEKSETMHFIDKNKEKYSTYKHKSLNQSSGSKPLMLLDNKVIKKKRRHNNEFKINF